MKTYRVWFTTSASKFIDVSADNIDEAEEIASDTFDYESANMHNNFVLDEWEVEEAEELDY